MSDTVIATERLSPLTDVFIAAAHHRERPAGTKPRMVVIHDMEAPETATMAEDLGRNWFANPLRNGQPVLVSTHYGVDVDSVVGYVDEDRAAFGARRQANDNGIHIEHAGFARQTADEWNDPYSSAMLDRSARLSADICTRHGIPVEFRDANDLQAGRIDGITTHAAITIAWGGSHTDPGPNFPLAGYISLVERYHRAPRSVPTIVRTDRDGKPSLGPVKTICSLMQRGLIGAGFDLGTSGPKGDGIDGIPGNKTFAAVAEFNRRNVVGLGALEQCTVDTWRALWPFVEGKPPRTGADELRRIATELQTHADAINSLIAEVRTLSNQLQT